MNYSDTDSLKIQNSTKSKKPYIILLLVLMIISISTFHVYSQTNNVGIGCTNPDASAILELRSPPVPGSPGLGFLAPRMAFADRPTTPITGLLIYQTDNNPGFYYYNGAAWVSMNFGSGTAGQVSFWASNNNLGGSNNLFWDNTNSRLGIGISIPTQSLEVYNGNIFISNNAISGKLMIGTPAAAFHTSFQTQAQAASIDYTLPAVVGIPGQVLSTDGITGILSWVNSVPAGTSGMTLRYDATNTLVSNLNIFNDGTNVGIGFAAAPALTQRLEVNGNILLTNSGTAAELMLATPGGTNFTSFKAQAQAGNVNYIIPAADGASGQALVTDGLGNLGWASISGSLPAGTSGQTLRYDITNTLVANSSLLNDGTNVSIANELRFNEPSPPGLYYTSFKAQVQATNVSYTLPAADGGAGQALVTNGGGTLSWASVSGSLPVGTSGQTLRYDATNALVANSTLFNDGTKIGIGTPTPSTLTHIFDNNITDKLPALTIEQSGTGDASMRYYQTTATQYFSSGINNSDNSVYEIANAGTLSATNAYTNANKMMRIHSTNAGIVDFNHQSRLRAYLNVIQTPIPTATWTVIKFDTKNFDEQTEFDEVTTNTYTAKATGYYQVNARAEFIIAGIIVVEDSYVSIRINSTGPKYSEGSNLAITGNTISAKIVTLLNNNAPSVSDIIFLQAGETITIEVYQTTGIDQSIQAGAGKTYMSIHKIS